MNLQYSHIAEKFTPLCKNRGFYMRALGLLGAESTTGFSIPAYGLPAGTFWCLGVHVGHTSEGRAHAELPAITTQKASTGDTSWNFPQVLSIGMPTSLQDSSGSLTTRFFFEGVKIQKTHSTVRLISGTKHKTTASSHQCGLEHPGLE